MAPSKYREVWERKDDGRAICALIQGDRGWLMYLREPGDSGYSSRDPDYAGEPDAKMDFMLSNGQRDEYPLAWTLPVAVIENALAHFRETGERAPFVTWHADQSWQVGVRRFWPARSLADDDALSAHRRPHPNEQLCRA